MRAVVAVAAVVCVLLAGCSAVPGDRTVPSDGAVPSDRADSHDGADGGVSVTPAPVPTDAPQPPTERPSVARPTTESSASYPPGVSALELDPLRLADAHFAVSRASSYVLRIERTRGPARAGGDAGVEMDVEVDVNADVDANPSDGATETPGAGAVETSGAGAPVERTVTVVRQASPTRYRSDTVTTFVRQGRTVSFREQLYADGETIHSAVTANGSRSYHETSFVSTESSRYDKQLRALVGRQFSVRDVTSIRPVREDGRTVYRVRGEGALFILPWNAVEYRIEAVVTPEGFVRSLTSSYRTGAVRHTLTLEYDDVGATEVSPPAWFTERDRTNATTTQEQGG